MGTGLKYYKEGLEKSQLLLFESIKEGINNSIFISLAQYLFWAFSIFEKNKVCTHGDGVLRGMRRYYNILKHEYEQNIVIEKTITVYPSYYPRRYPYAYGIIEPIAIFKSIHDIPERRQNYNENKYYEKHVAGKTVREIINYITNKVNNIESD